MPLLSSSRKAEEFARLLEGSGGSGSAAGSEMSTLQQLASRLSAVPQPRPEFASALRQRLMSEATATLPSAASGAAGSGTGTTGAGSTSAGSGSAGSGGAGSGGAGSGGAGSVAGGSAPTGVPSAASAVSTATAGGGTAAGGSVVSAVMSATVPVWAQFTAIVAATGIAIGGVGVGASQSLPGDPLYGVKRQIEQIQLELAGGRTDTALAQLGFARTRLSEIADLLKGRNADAPLSPELQKRISGLLTDWASETSQGTTVLLDQLRVASSNLALRQKLTDFTDSQARALALVVQRLPDQRLQSLSGSAFAYLQRVDSALGNPVNLATLLPSLGLPLPTTGPATSNGSGATSAGTSTGGAAGSKTNTPTSVPTLPIPTNGSTSTGGSSTPSLPKVPSTTLPSGGGTGQVGTSVGNGVGDGVGTVGGAVGNTVNGATSSVDNTVTGVLNGVTGKGPVLPLPTSVPIVSGLSR